MNKKSNVKLLLFLSIIHYVAKRCIRFFFFLNVFLNPPNTTLKKIKLN